MGLEGISAELAAGALDIGATLKKPCDLGETHTPLIGVQPCETGKLNHEATVASGIE